MKDHTFSFNPRKITSIDPIVTMLKKKMFLPIIRLEIMKDFLLLVLHYIAS